MNFQHRNQNNFHYMSFDNHPDRFCRSFLYIHLDIYQDNPLSNFPDNPIDTHLRSSHYILRYNHLYMLRCNLDYNYFDIVPCIQNHIHPYRSNRNS